MHDPSDNDNSIQVTHTAKAPPSHHETKPNPEEEPSTARSLRNCIVNILVDLATEQAIEWAINLLQIMGS